MTRILFLADINSTHTRKWVLSLATKGFEIGIFSLNKPNSDWFKDKAGITYLSNDSASDVKGKSDSSKLSYIKAIPALKRAILKFKPDIVHAHYATSYGMLGALSGFHPFILSVWGSDVFEFPKKSFIHKLLLRYNLSKANIVLSTSNSMAEEVAKYTKTIIEVTPFGIDTEVFKPQPDKPILAGNEIVVGTIKALEPVYGIKYLIEAFDILVKRHADKNMRLLIVGGGSQEAELRAMCASFGIADKVEFTGMVNYKDIPDYHNKLDVYVALSENESFGVSVLEAGACARPVVVSNVSGFAEIVENGVTGIIVPIKNAKVAASGIEKIMMDKEYARHMGEKGRKRVEQFYDWDTCVSKMASIYNSMPKQ